METLAFYNVETVSTATTLNLGAAAPSSSDDLMLRVVNNNPLYQAEDVTVAVSGPNAACLWLSLDGDTFTASINVGDLPPAALSPPFFLRRVTASTDSGNHTAQLSATPAGWSNPVDTSTSDNVPLETGD